MCFNFYDEVDFDCEIKSYYLDELEVFAYYIPMLNTDDLLLASEVNGLLKPIMFIEFLDNKILLKDINNKKITNILKMSLKTDIFKIDSINYFEENDSKTGLALSVGCMGGSTSACIEIAVTSCMQDPACAFGCSIVWRECLGGIVLACAANCLL